MTRPRDILGPPPGDEGSTLFNADKLIHALDLDHDRAALVRSVMSDGPGRETALAALIRHGDDKALSAYQAMQQAAIVDRLTRLNGRVGRAEEHCERVMAGETRYGCAHLENLRSDFRANTARTAGWAAGVAAAITFLWRFVEHKLGLG